MTFTIRLRTRLAPLKHNLVLVTAPEWNPASGVAGEYRLGTWRFALPDNPVADGERFDFKFYSTPGGWMVGPDLSATWAAGGEVRYSREVARFTTIQAGGRGVGGLLPRWVGPLLGFLLLTALLLTPLPVWAALDGRPNASSGACPGLNQPPDQLPITDTAVYKLIDTHASTVHTLAFGRSRKPRSISVELSPELAAAAPADSASPPAPLPSSESVAAVMTGIFSRSDDEPLNSNLIRVDASVEGGQIVVSLCAQRTGSGTGAASLGDPGSYSGTISVASTDIVRTDIPITVTLAYPAWQLVLELLILVLIPAAWYLWVMHDPSSSGSLFLSSSILKYSGTRIGFLTLAVGALAGFSVYLATYLGSDTWGSSSTQVFTLFGAMFTAAITAASGVHLGAKIVENSGANSASQGS